jgi:hypothetical protein
MQNLRVRLSVYQQLQLRQLLREARESLQAKDSRAIA